MAINKKKKKNTLYNYHIIVYVKSEKHAILNTKFALQPPNNLFCIL